MCSSHLRSAVEEKKSNETIKFQGPAKNCLAQNSFHLEGDIYASVCRHRGRVLLDIRRFIDQSQGLLPTVRGIFLSPEQWNVLKTKVDFIDRSFKRVEDGVSMDARLLHPFTLICSGPTGSGKTQFVKRMILEGESVVDKPPDRILWLYGEYQDAYYELKASIPNIRFVEGFPPN